MAINNWRHVVTWWYMDPNGNIVEERQYVPEVTTSTTTSPATTNYFPNTQAYALQAQGYAGQWNNAMANAFWELANDLWAYSNYANNTINTYNALWNWMNANEEALRNVAWNTYNTLIGDIQTQKDYINRMFGPEGELTREVNTYYDDLGNYLSTEAWRQAANIAAQGVHSWASLWAIRAQQNEAYNEAFWRYVQAKEQQINAKQQIASNLINYMSTLRQEYWNTTNQYIIDLYKRANDLYNQTAASLANDLNQYNTLRLSWSWGGWGSSSSSSITDLLDKVWLTANSDGTYSDGAWNKYKLWADGKLVPVTKGTITSEAEKNLGNKTLWEVIKSRTGINPDKSLWANIVSALNPVNAMKVVSTALNPEQAVKDIVKDKNFVNSLINYIIK